MKLHGMKSLPFSDPMFTWADFGISTEKTARWPFTLGLVLSLIVMATCLIADANAATASVAGQSCPIRSAAYLATRDLRIDCATPYWVCPDAQATYSQTLVLELHSACQNDRVSSSGFEP